MSPIPSARCIARAGRARAFNTFAGPPARADGYYTEAAAAVLMGAAAAARAGRRGAQGPPRAELGAIHQGDCLEVMASIPDASIGTVVTSPPYNIRNSTGNGLRGGRGSGKWPNAPLLDGYAEHADAMPHAEYVRWQRECLREMMRVLREDGAIFYNHKWRVQNGRMQGREEIVRGLPVRQIIIWQREGGINFNPGYFLPTYEVIYLIAKPAFRLAPRANRIGDVWRLPQERSSAHPAPFPVQLARNCIASTDNGTVMDPFLGSGTTAVAAKIHGRRWIGIEKSPEYCELARRRIEGAASISQEGDVAVRVIPWGPRRGGGACKL